jgi:hypothetical protein
MKNLSTTLKNAFLVVGLMIVAILVCPPTGAGEDGTTSAISGRDFYPRGNLSDSRAENSSGATGLTGLIIPLTQSLSLDLRLSSVGTGQALPGGNQLGTPPVPIPKAPGSDLRYSRLGVGLSFGF